MEPDPQESLQIDLAQYKRLRDARERGLVLSARGITYAILRVGEHWNVRVSVEDVPAAMREILAYEEELRQLEEMAEVSQEEPGVRVRAWSLVVVALGMIVFAVVQAEAGQGWRELGILNAERVVGRGEWWRPLTALTLHGDVPHVVANLWTILLFGGLLLPAMGQGVTWLMVVLTGALGNACNALSYYPEAHRSLGASTAVFGALGLLVGDSLGVVLQRRSGRSWWRWVLPVGAGVALLAYLGAGEGRGSVDVLAHLWGFVLGAPLGFVLSWARLVRAGARVQMLCGMGAVLLPVGAWVFARMRG